jgi:predicted ATPase/tetratricopeptide (TPR) repeat protein
VPIELTLLQRTAYNGKEITSPRLRALLALFAADLKAGCSASRLIDGIWHDDPPENPSKALQILVSRARSLLGNNIIETIPNGYRLSLTEDQVDVSSAVAHATSAAQLARAGDQRGALTHAEAGLALWSGGPSPADEDVDSDEPIASLQAAMWRTHRTLERVRALARSRLGEAADALEPLTDLHHMHPHDEEVLLELLRSEAATAGVSAALARYEVYRARLRDELGADPGHALQDLHQQLLRNTEPPVRHGVTHEPNALLGRDDDIAEVDRLLHSSRVTSIVGAGGLGKTRLAHAVLRQTDQPLGYFVPLAGVMRDQDVVEEVAAAIGARDSARTSTRSGAVHNLRAAIAAALGPGPALLVLDNCEQVIEGVAELVQSLVAMTAQLRILTTSRAPLGLTSESVYLLPEMTLPTAVALFTQRARSARPDADLPADVVADLCRHLDGLPLAIELAAARTRVMSAPEITQRLGDRFALLRGSKRDAPERHRTLRAVIDWSWKLLDVPGQRAMRILSILPGGFTAATAAQVLYDGAPGGDSGISGDIPRPNGDHGEDVLDILEQLVEQSMLMTDDEQAGVRFRMLETVREFSATERTNAGDDETAIDGLLSWARRVCEANYAELFGADPFTSYHALRPEQDNLSFAMRCALARDDGRTTAATAAVLSCLAIAESNYPRISSVVEETSWLLSHYQPKPPHVEVARAALALNVTYTFMLEGPRATRAMAALRRLPPPEPETYAGAVTVILNATRDDAEKLWDLCDDNDDTFVAAAANALASYLWEIQNDIEKALNAAYGALRLTQKRGRPWFEALAHSRIGELCFQLERADDAVYHLSEAVPVFDELGAATDALGLRWWIVLAHLQRGNADEAERWAQSVPETIVDAKFGTLGYDVAARAEVLLAKGDVHGGLRLWRQVLDLLENTPDQLSAGIPPEFDPWTVEARAVATVAHAQHGEVDLISHVPEKLRQRLSHILTTPIVNPPPYIMEFQLSGSMLMALGMAHIAAGRSREGVRTVALAERFGYQRTFQPTMSSTRIQLIAKNTDQAAYEDAVASFADLDRDALPAAALTLLPPQ